MDSILEVKDLQKSFGSKLALDHVSFSVSTGSCFGLLGPNGAGKSTTMRLITGIDTFKEGSITLFGEPLTENDKNVQKQIGYVPQTISFMRN